MEAHIRPKTPLTELHCHLGQSVEPHVLWAIAHEQGIKLPTKDYWEFVDLVTLNYPETTWEHYHRLFHLTELVQSSPAAMERAAYEAITGAYRVSNITLLEPGFNPLNRNRDGERDLDYIILAALRGMERALLEFPGIRAGLHLMLDRRFSYEKNAIIVKKAIKYRSRGIVGIDIVGPKGEQPFQYEDYTGLYEEAIDAGLKTTVHTGEDGTAEEMAHVVSVLPLSRINHGFRCYTDPVLMETVRKKDITLCLCPTSNLSVKFIRDMAHMKEIVRTLWDHGVKLCFNTDNPSMLRTTLPREIGMMREHGILSEDEIAQTLRWAEAASFVPTEPGKNLYL